MSLKEQSERIYSDQDHKLDAILDTLRAVADRLAIVEEKTDNPEICQKLEVICKRVEGLEVFVSQKDSFTVPPPVTRNTEQASSYSPERPSAYVETRQTRPDKYERVTGDTFPPSSDPVSSVDIQSDFRALRDKYAQIELPAHFRVSADRAGVKRDDQPRINLISSCSKYSETLLKLAGSSDRGQSLESLKQEIYIASCAQHKYLQSEYSAVLVDNSFDPQVSKFYRQLRKNTSAFDPDSLSDLKDAISVCAQYKPSEQGYRGRGRGGFQRGRGRYRGHQGQDVYNRLAQIPQHRPNQG